MRPTAEATRAARREIADVAAAMAAGETGIAEGCRRVMTMRDRLSKPDVDDADLVTLALVGYDLDQSGNLMEPDLSDDDLLWMVAVESELDDVPLGSARERWDPAALAETDLRVAAYLERVGPRSCASWSVPRA